MSLRQLTVTDFRNLKTINIEPGDRLNVFFGDNGSGKTSLLESINTLSLARSFRTHKQKNLINHGSQSYTVFGKVENDSSSLFSVGIQRSKNGEGAIRVNQKNLTSAAELAELLPVRVINTSSFLILDGPPLERRSMLDWLMFHVEHEFYGVWKQHEKCVKQRNSLLRHDKIDPLQLDIWDDELAPLVRRLDTIRSRGFALLKEEFYSLIKDIEGLPGQLKLHYSRGWDKESDICVYLKQHRERDIGLGYTRHGAHRADIRVTVGGLLASEVLSRGQQKIVICALLLAQGMAFTRYTQRRCVYLIDDLPAELDLIYRKQLCSWLEELGSQVFVTGVQSNELLESWPETTEYKLFHVKHGTVAEVTCST
ncbi:MAG: DNA replication/repair protein RecF [Candidatus Pelagadaptatus aseana]|uniref:DNA replication/repair protein RecF n=1 Tax=Candidatus Pelagadaptatus aseana TaxID=3120508 RepID=UPI0039B17315